MKKTLHFITDHVSTNKGAWITVAVWLVIAMLLAFIAPSSKDYEVTSIETLPEDAQSVIASKKLDKYFEESDGIPALLVFQTNKDNIKLPEITGLLDKMEQKNIYGIKDMIPLAVLPPEVALTFFSKDQTAALIPMTFESNLDTKEIKAGLEKI